MGWTSDHDYNQNLLIYSNNKLILRLKRFNLAVATNKRLVMLAFNLLPYYLRTTFFTVSRQMVFCVFYIIICAMPYINNQMWINFLRTRRGSQKLSFCNKSLQKVNQLKLSLYLFVYSIFNFPNATKFWSNTFEKIKEYEVVKRFWITATVLSINLSATTLMSYSYIFDMQDDNLFIWLIFLMVQKI